MPSIPKRASVILRNGCGRLYSLPCLWSLMHCLACFAVSALMGVTLMRGLGARVCLPL